MMEDARWRMRARHRVVLTDVGSPAPRGTIEKFSAKGKPWIRWDDRNMVHGFYPLYRVACLHRMR